jgi:2-keto-3-deoxy-L-rhamnonate aldolase RhmA
MVEMAAAAGFDFVYLDLEHGSFGFDAAIHLIRAAEASGTTPLGRWFVASTTHHPYRVILPPIKKRLIWAK